VIAGLRVFQQAGERTEDQGSYGTAEQLAEKLILESTLDHSGSSRKTKQQGCRSTEVPRRQKAGAQATF
jgi:hypothetical protein